MTRIGMRASSGLRQPRRAPGCRKRWSARVAAAVVAAAAASPTLAGCGTSTSDRPAVCKIQAQDAIARKLGIASANVSYAKSFGGNDMPQCRFGAHASGVKLAVIVNVDSGPQAYARILRTVVEASQIFGRPPPGWRRPQVLSGLGPYASWFPTNHQLMATNYTDLFTVTVSWPGASRNGEVAIARAAVVPYRILPKGP